VTDQQLVIEELWRLIVMLHNTQVVAENISPNDDEEKI
jgi:hypothetical protein